MRISSVHVFKENLALTRPYTISYKTVDSVENVIVQLRLANGMVGYGAANPSPYVVGVNVDDSLHTLNEKAQDVFLGKDIRSFQHLLEWSYSSFEGDAGARVAADLALHDAFTQFLGIPVVDYYGQKIKSLPTSVTIGIMGVEDTLEEAREYLDAGFKVIKVKLGKELKEDIERLKAMRQSLPKGLVIRIDANQGWTKSETESFFQSTANLDIELIEQPVKAEQIQQLGALPEQFKKRIAADESLIDSHDAAQLAKNPQPAGIFNIKLMKCGGIWDSKRIAHVAASSGIDLMWGCNDESIISIAGALHAALSCSNTKYLDLDGSFDLAKDVVQGGFILLEGHLSVNGKPGLGLQALDQAFHIL